MQRSRPAAARTAPFCLLLVALVFAVATASAFSAESAADAVGNSLRVFPEGKKPDDRRLGSLKTLNGYFPFAPPKTEEEWQRRKEEVRRQILVATGLWPMPRATPANPVIHGKVERDGFTVERVFFESYPGHFVTGSLFRPVGRTGKMPGVLCPYGHWANGRFYRNSMKDVRQQIAAGAERFEASGQCPLQARCVQLARMGCVVFHYDMISTADSQQLPGIGHHPPPRPHMDTRENWGFYSTQAELRLQSIIGLQTYNSLRALDFVSNLPDVDAERIGVTGASGGGTQTFILCAIDDRPAVAVPAVMVSTAMQGGCTCENCSLLRIGTGNVEFAALFAPKPQCLIGADDWTVEIATKGGPELQQLYSLLGAKNHIKISPHNQFGHNYNYVSREVMYQWMNRHLGLNQESPVIEEDFKPLSITELTVWDDRHPKPPSGEDYERSLVRYMTEEAEQQLEKLAPTDTKSLPEFRNVVGGAWKVLIGRSLPELRDVEFKQIGETAAKEGGYRLTKGIVRNKAHGEEVPVIVLESANGGSRTAVWLSKEGKAGLFDASGKPSPGVQSLLDAGLRVVGIDLMEQGELIAGEKPATKGRLVRDRGGVNRVAGFTFGYNPSLFAQRVHDVLTAVAYFAKPQDEPNRELQKGGLLLAGLNGTGHWAAVAKMIAGDAIDRVAIDTDGFRFDQVAAIDDPNFLPGAAKYFDLPGVMALGAPGKLWVREAQSKPNPRAPDDLTRAAYQAAGVAANLVTSAEPKEAAESAAVKWLLQKN